MKVSVKITNDYVTASVNEKVKRLQLLPNQGLEEFRKLTPKDTGRARRETILVKETIVADYPYAQPLNKGTSKQAPRGITEPFSHWWRRQVDIILKRK